MSGGKRGVHIIFSETNFLELECNVCRGKGRCCNKSTCCVLNPVIFSEKSERPAPVWANHVSSGPYRKWLLWIKVHGFSTSGSK